MIPGRVSSKEGVPAFLLRRSDRFDGDGVPLTPPAEPPGDFFACFALDAVVAADAAPDVLDGVLLRFFDTVEDDFVCTGVNSFSAPW